MKYHVSPPMARWTGDGQLGVATRNLNPDPARSLASFTWTRQKCPVQLIFASPHADILRHGGPGRPGTTRKVGPNTRKIIRNLSPNTAI
jgi:hypothetical protein